MDVPFTGGCACGAIRYECSAEPLFSGSCHCRDCQRSSGGACSTVVLVSAASLTLLQGSPQTYSVQVESGNTARRDFCSECGSPLFAGNSASPDFVSIKVGSLDDPSWATPQTDIWTKSAQPWACLNPDLPKVRQTAHIRTISGTPRVSEVMPGLHFPSIAFIDREDPLSLKHSSPRMPINPAKRKEDLV